MTQNYSSFPCPICHKKMFIIGTDNKGKKIASCGHAFSFKRTRSQKENDRKYIRTSWGLELAPK
jgi:hypothetical protein